MFTNTQTYLRRLQRRRILWILAILFVASGITLIHAWNLDSIPLGMYQDETAIGYNAALIAKNGTDEYRLSFPLYFKSFDDYKAPIYIYASAAIFRIFGISTTSLRLTSVFFFVILLAGTTLIANLLTPKNKRLFITPYILIACGFFPWFFPLSRIAFEVISQPAITIFALYFLFLAYTGRSQRALLLASLAGGSFGVSLYTYPTGRLLAFLFVASAMLVFARKKTFQQSLAFLSAFVLTLIPYAVYTIQNTGNVTARFRGITYVYDASLTLQEKVQIFFTNYAQYFRPEFLLYYGDENTRHATGFGGEASMVVFVFAVIGVAWILFDSFAYHRRFGVFLCIGFLVSPVAAALTNEGTPHSLRSILMGVFLLLLSIYGLLFFLRHHNVISRYAAVTAVVLMLSVESSTYTMDYFHRYAEKSVSAFGYPDFPDVFQKVVTYAPKNIRIDHRINYTYPRFYAEVMGIPQKNISFTNYRGAAPDGRQCILSLENDTDDIKIERTLLEDELFGELRLRCTE